MKAVWISIGKKQLIEAQLPFCLLPIYMLYDSIIIGQISIEVQNKQKYQAIISTVNALSTFGFYHIFLKIISIKVLCLVRLCMHTGLGNLSLLCSVSHLCSIGRIPYLRGKLLSEFSVIYLPFGNIGPLQSYGFQICMCIILLVCSSGRSVF